MRIFDADYEHAGPISGSRNGLLHTLVQVVPVKEKLAGDGALVTPFKNSTQRELPDALINRALNGDGVTNFPAVLIGQCTTDQTARAVPQHRLHLLGRQDQLVVEIKVNRQGDGELREEIFRLLIDAAKPVADADLGDAINRADAIPVIRRHGEGERDCVPRNQAIGRRRVRASVPGVHDSAEQTEGNYRNDETNDREQAAQACAEDVFEN